MLRMTYVSAGGQVAIDGIGPGVYVLSFDSGSVWSRSASGFKSNRTVPRSIGPFSFTQIQTAGQVRGDQYRFVLREGGNTGSETSPAGI